MKQVWFCAAAVAVSSFLGAASLHADFDSDYKEARTLYLSREYDKALAAYEKLAQSTQDEKQKQTAYEQAVNSAFRLRDYDKAMSLAKAMPDKHASINAQARVMLTRRERQEVIELYKAQDMSTWPKTDAADGYNQLAIAYRITGKADEALAALDKAMELDDRDRLVTNYYISRGEILETYKKDLDGALEAYRKAYEVTDEPGRKANASVHTALVLIEQNKGQDALDEVSKPEYEKIQAGYYAGQIAIAKGKALAKLGKKEEAKAAFEKALEVKGLYASQKKTVEAELEALK